VILCALGDLMLDLIVRIERPLARGDDTPALTRAGAGGQAANVAAWAAALGAQSRLIAKWGGDTPGRLVAAEAAEAARVADTIEAYRDALALRKQLAADFPIQPEFRENLAVICISLGDLLAAGDRPAEAESTYRDALGLLKQLTADRPDQPEFREGLASTHYLLGRTLS